jgi:hypothetical protein
MTVELKHSLHFITLVDETHAGGIELMNLEESVRTEILESMLKELLTPVIQPVIDELNERGTFAILKVAE